MDEPNTNLSPVEGADVDTREHVRAMFAQLSRTLLAFKLYAPSNQLRKDLFAELVRRVAEVFEREELVIVDIEPRKLTWLGEPILELGEQENSFVFNLYKDGARQIGFQRGITEDELQTLLEIVQVRPQLLDPNFSVVDALWEADFRHVSHIAVDGFSEMLEDELEDERPTGLASRFERLITDLVGRPQTAARSAEAARVSADVQALPDEASDDIRISDRIASPIKGFLEAPKAAQDEAVDRWVEALQTREDTLLATVEELLLHWLESPEPPFDDDELTALLSRLARRWLARGNFPVAGELLTRLQHVRFEVPERAGVAQAVLDEMGVRALRELILAGGGLEDAVWDLSEATRFFERHLAVGDDELVDLLALELGLKGARLLGHMMTQRVAARPDFWSDHFSTMPAEVAAVSLASLATLHESNPDVLGAFHRALEHPEPLVRLTALRCYPGPYHERIREHLLALLESDDPDVRCAAIERLGESQDGSLGAFLVNRVRRVGLAGLTPEEAESITRAILQLGPERYTPFIRGQLDQLGLARGKEPREAAAQVRAVLGVLATARGTAPRELLRDVRGQARGELREWCDELWRSLLAEWKPAAEDEVESAEPDAPQAALTNDAAQPPPSLQPDRHEPTPTPIPAVSEFSALPEEAPDDLDVFEEPLVTFLAEENDD